MSIDTFRNSSSSSAVRLIPFDKAEVIPGIINGTWFLHVSGDAPCGNMEVLVLPMVYIDCPKYWGIEIVGYLPQPICIRSVKPYDITIPLGGITGSEGIEVIGSNKKEQFEVSGGCS